jgi:hypothetical protein
MSQMQPMQPSQPSSPSNPSYKLDSLIDMLWRAFQEELTSAGGFSLTDSCERRVKEFIIGGAQELIRTHAQRYDVGTAEDNIRQFARRLAEMAQGRGTSIITDAMFISITSLLCPLWPFC